MTDRATDWPLVETRSAWKEWAKMGTTSFPFLKIARDFGVSYGDVIRVADTWMRQTPWHPDERASFKRLSEDVQDAIIEAREAEDTRRLWKEP